MVAKLLRQWLDNQATKTIYIEPGSPWENWFSESFIGKLRNELLDGEMHDRGAIREDHDRARS